MAEYCWHGYRLEIDGDATRSWYAQGPEWGCTCGHCRNFLALARNRLLPTEILEILDSLSIPPEKTTDLSELEHGDGRLLYDLHYRVAGRVLEKPEEGAPQSGCGFWCQDDPKLFYPYGTEDFPEPSFDIGFFPWLPWVLDESL